MSEKKTPWATLPTVLPEEQARWAREWPTPQQAQEKEQERKLLLQLARDYAPLDARIVQVRQKAPPGLLTNQTLADEYQALKQRVDGAPELKLDGIRGVLAEVNALRLRANAVEQVLALAPAAPAAVAWALGRREACAQDAMQRMRTALNQPVPDGNGWSAAVGDLGTMQPEIAAYELEAAKFDYQAVLQNANKDERGKLQAQKRKVDTATALIAPDAFAQALPHVQELGRLVASCAKARTEREELLRKPRDDAKALAERVEKALTRLRVVKSDLLAGLAEAFQRLMLETVEPLMKGEGDVDERSIQSGMGKLRGLCEKIEKCADGEEQRIADERQRAADKLSYKRYKFDVCTTWAMQPAIWDNRIKRNELELTGKDTANLNAIFRGQLGDHGAVNPVAGFAYHCHMCDDGGGGISFAYKHLGGNRVQPVIYDWATKRQDNIYTWKISGTKTNSAVKKPSDVTADVPPED